MTIRGYAFIATLLIGLTAAFATTVVAANPQSAGYVVEFGMGVVIKPRGQSRFLSPKPRQPFRVGDLLRVPSGSVAKVLCPDGSVADVLANGSSQGFAQICPKRVKTSRSGGPSYQTGNPVRDPNSLHIISPRQTIVRSSNPKFIWNVVNRSASYQVSLTSVLWQNEVTKANQYSYVPGELAPALTTGAYRFVVEAHDDRAFLSRQEQSLQITTPPTVARRLVLNWTEVPGASRYLISIEQQEPLWKTQVSGSRVVYSGNLPSGRYTLRVIANTAGENADRQQFLAQDFSSSVDNEVSNAMRALDVLDKQSLPPVVKALKRAQIFADNYMFSNAIANLEALAVRDNQIVGVYRRLGELQQQIGLMASAKDSYTKALELATSQGDTEEQQALRAELSCLSEGTRCNP